MPLSGCLIAESLRTGGLVDGIRLTVTKVSRADVGDVDAGQPLTWTFIDFELPDDHAERFARGLEGALAHSRWVVLRLPQRHRNLRRIRRPDVPISTG